ncbi:hypothetical protein HMPREF1869_00173 [Bacteroidales bacterium KA00251]|nr:hypothetical protein HMPREF1869_00173 [Bacteroidales bacterium KA00251]
MVEDSIEFSFSSPSFSHFFSRYTLSKGFIIKVVILSFCRRRCG